MKILLICFICLIINNCVHIENRCIDSGLIIKDLKIEDTGVFTTHAKVQCTKGDL